MSKITTQTDIDKYVSNIVSSLYSDDFDIQMINWINFLKDNYHILEKKSKHTRLEHLLIKNAKNPKDVYKNFRYTAPETILLYVKTIAFYFALDNFKISFSK